MPESERFDQIKGVLFDKDGTLFDYYLTWVPILQGAARLAARGDAEKAERLMGACGFDVVTGRVLAGGILAAGNTVELADLWSSSGKDWDIATLTQVLDDHFSTEAPLRSAPVTDLVSFFRGLRAAGYCTGIATNDNEASALATVVRFELADHVDFVCGYDSGHGAKPEPGMIHAFCAATGLDPSQVAMVGDNFHDLEMARRAGAGLKVGVLTGTSLRADLEAHADIVLESIVALPSFLSGAR